MPAGQCEMQHQRSFRKLQVTGSTRRPRDRLLDRRPVGMARKRPRVSCSRRPPVGAQVSDLLRCDRQAADPGAARTVVCSAHSSTPAGWPVNRAANVRRIRLSSQALSNLFGGDAPMRHGLPGYASRPAQPRVARAILAKSGTQPHHCVGLILVEELCMPVPGGSNVGVWRSPHARGTPQQTRSS